MKKLTVLMMSLSLFALVSQQVCAADAPASAEAKATKETSKPAEKKVAAKPVTKNKTAAAGSSKMKTEEQRVSYIIGLQMGNNLANLKKQSGFAAEADLVAQGIKDSLAGGDLKLTQEEISTTMQSFQQKMQAKQKEQAEKHQAEMKVVGDKNEKEGKAFLEANAKKEGVVTTKSGLQYRVLTEGKGPKPKATDTVTVNYRGTLVDGKEFDSSYKRGQPATFAVGAVIPGWTEVLQLMPEGSKWEVVIPSELAYGANGAGADIGPNSVLVFEIELLKASNDSGDK